MIIKNTSGETLIQSCQYNADQRIGDKVFINGAKWVITDIEWHYTSHEPNYSEGVDGELDDIVVIVAAY